MRVTLSCPDISCCGCAASIQRATADRAGVSNTEVNVASKTVTAEVENVVVRQALVDLLDEIGFPVAEEPPVRR